MHGNYAPLCDQNVGYAAISFNFKEVIANETEKWIEIVSMGAPNDNSEEGNEKAYGPPIDLWRCPARQCERQDIGQQEADYFAIRCFRLA